MSLCSGVCDRGGAAWYTGSRRAEVERAAGTAVTGVGGGPAGSA